MLRNRLRFSLLLASAASLWACGPTGDLPTAPRPSEVAQPSLIGGLTGTVTGLVQGVTGLLSCTPQPYVKTQRYVGTGGGLITVGRHTLSIPAGALRSTVLITAEAISDGKNTVRFQPEGLRFATSSRLVLDYSNCSLLGISLPRQIVYTDELLKILEVIPSLDSALNRKVSGPINHFSRYAVAW